MKQQDDNDVLNAPASDGGSVTQQQVTSKKRRARDECNERFV